MRLQPSHTVLLPVLVLASCSFGPRLETSMPQIRSIPVLANLSVEDSLVRARTFLAAKQYGLAIELYKAASRDSALAAESFNGLAVAYDGIGRRDLAERYFERALAASPGDARAKRNLAVFYSASGQDGKRRELMAEPVPASVPVSEAKTDRPRATIAETPVAGISRTVVLNARSPLGSSFRPLMVPASLGSVPVNSPTSRAVADTTIICVPGNDPDRPAPDKNTVEIFRINIGEIFVVTRPNDASCSLQPGYEASEGDDAAPSLSNREYLRLVADQLDRINTGAVPVADISRLWRAVFWSRDGQA